MKELLFNIGADDVGRSVKDFLLRGGISVTLLKKIKYGGIMLNGAEVTVRAILKEGDVLKITAPKERSEGIPPMDIPLRIAYEDEYFLAVDKPRNMPTHPSKGNSLPTLANAVMGYFGGDFVFRSVNRLDRDTSGLVIIAKDQMSAGALSESMKRGEFRKYYECIVEGIPSPTEGVIDAPIMRESEGSIKRIVHEDGKRAVTEYKTISTEGGRAKLRIRLHTGRTHQIRVHMAHIGHPLVGDFLYGVDGDDFYLRCVEIDLPHPKSGEMICIKAEVLCE
ncbi:MAG: RluA family pseudouridine synthase [Clostridia bacterium]|nr:RluA family pseudouridine synthase [Clostridia bacterium]